MRREHNLATTTDIPLSVFFSQVNSTYTGKYKRLIPNYTDDGLVFLLISDSISALNTTIVVGDNDGIITTLNATLVYPSPWMTRRIPMGVINGIIAITDNTSQTNINKNFKLRRYQYNYQSKTLSALSIINSGSNYPTGPDGGYMDNLGNEHFYNTQNVTYNCPSDYNLITGSYTRNQSSTYGHYSTIVLNDNFDGSGQKLFIYLKQVSGNAGSFTCYYTTLPNNKLASDSASYSSISNSVTLAGPPGGILGSCYMMACRKFNEHNKSRIYNAYDGTEVLYNSTYTSISVGSVDSLTPALNCHFPRLYIDDNMTKFWSIDYANDANFDVILTQ